MIEGCARTTHAAYLFFPVLFTTFPAFSMCSYLPCVPEVAIAPYPTTESGLFYFCLILHFLRRWLQVLARWEREFQAREDHDPHLGVRWKVPIRLCDEHKLGSTASLDEEVYPFTSFGVAKGDMPVITPSYPAYNSAGNVNPWTLRVMNEELERGRQLGLEAEKLAASGIDAKGRVEAIAKTLDTLVEGEKLKEDIKGKHLEQNRELG